MEKLEKERSRKVTEEDVKILLESLKTNVRMTISNQPLAEDMQKYRRNNAVDLMIQGVDKVTVNKFQSALIHQQSSLAIYHYK